MNREKSESLIRAIARLTPAAHVFFGVALLAAGSFLTTACGAQPAPDTVPGTTDTIQYVASTVSVDGKVLTGQSKVQGSHTVATDGQGTADIRFAEHNGKIAECALNNQGKISSLTTRPVPLTGVPEVLFRQETGSSYLVWVGGSGKSETVQAVRDIFIDSPDPAMRIVIVPDQGARVAVYEGMVNITLINNPNGETRKREIYANEEADIDLRTRQISVVRASFTESEEGIFQRIARDLGAVLTPSALPIYRWTLTSGQPPLSDVRVQEAMCLALDEQGITKSLFAGKPGVFQPEIEFASTAYDLSLAKQLLTDAGYPDGFKMGLFAAPSGDSMVSQLMDAVTKYLSQVGVNASPAFFASASEFPKGQAYIAIERLYP